MRYKNHKNRKLNIKEEGGVENMRKGFTLIELLIVIVIIGILAGAVLAVINPAQVRRRANVSVLRANVDKMCLAMSACASSATNAADCNGEAAIGIQVAQMNGTPVGATYTYTDLATGASGTLAADGGFNACTYSCTHTFASGQSTPVTATVPADCFNL